MEEHEHGTTVRFFQWVDDNDSYTGNSILSRALYNKKRFIRWADENEAVIPEGDVFLF